MIIALDVDGVLLDYADALDRFMAEKFPEWFKGPKTDIYELHKRYDIPPMYMHAIADLFAESERFHTLAPYKNAIPNVRKLYEAGHRIVAVTACLDSEITKRLRYDNLKMHFGNAISEIHYVGVHGSKSDILHKIKPDVFVDDLINHLNGAPESTSKYLMLQPWNKDELFSETNHSGYLDRVVSDLNFLVDMYC